MTNKGNKGRYPTQVHFNQQQWEDILEAKWLLGTTQTDLIRRGTAYICWMVKTRYAHNRELARIEEADPNFDLLYQWSDPVAERGDDVLDQVFGGDSPD